MRARTVNLRKCYVFDLDETLVKTSAKVRVLKNGRTIRTLTPEEFNYYVKAPDEDLDLSEFKDPRIIYQARPYKMWPALQNISTAIKQGRSSSAIFILTARSSVMKPAIWTFFQRRGIDIPEENIYTIGDDKGKINISEEKKNVLRRIGEAYDDITFFDDNPENIRIAQEVGGIRTRLIDSMNI